MLITYAAFMDVVARILLGLGVIAGLVCVVDWAIRARKISPFNAVARFFRRSVDPMMRPMESRIVRFGGQPASAPLWLFLGIVVAGIVLLQVLRVVGDLLTQATVALTMPGVSPKILLIIAWALQFLMLALLYRVISTWLPVSPYSKWVRWSYVTTEWLLAPLRKIIPSFGAFDVTPIVAYFIILIVQRVIGV
jgi:YggT family protein